MRIIRHNFAIRLILASSQRCQGVRSGSPSGKSFPLGLGYLPIEGSPVNSAFSRLVSGVWVRLRLDIGWPDLLRGFVFGFLPGDRRSAYSAAKKAWSKRDNFLIALSVRSGFDLVLRALNLPRGAEILFTALTVPDMASIARHHGVVPIPLDLRRPNEIDLQSLRQAISPRTKAIVVAHLFGGNASLEDLLVIAREHNVMVIEDIAQGFRSVGESGHPDSDVAMFSFGPIKSVTALGGGVMRVASPQLLETMVAIQSRDPVASNLAFAKRVIRFAGLKFFSGRSVFGLLCVALRRIGYDRDAVLGDAGRGFPSDGSISRFRKQPSKALLRLMKHRWQTVSPERLRRRVRHGERLDRRLGIRRPAQSVYWVYPVFSQEPDRLCERLRARGFDATRCSRMKALPAANVRFRPGIAEAMWAQIVFLPWYPELSDQAVQQMADVITDTATIRDRDAVPFKRSGRSPRAREHRSAESRVPRDGR